MGNKTALITGGTSGIGYEIAISLAQKGYDLFIVSRSLEKLSNTKKDLEDRFEVKVDVMELDLAKSGSAQRVYEEVKNRNYEIETLINNAGVGLHGEQVELDIEPVDEMLHLNIITLTELCTLFGKEMKEKKEGHILNIASTGAYQPFPYMAAYCATKSYVLNFSEALTKELEDYNVHVTCVSPGVTDTDFFNKMGVGDAEKGFWKKSTRMSPRKVAEVAIKALFSNKLSVIPGLKNKFLAFISRFVPRSIVAMIAKAMSKARE